MGSGQGVNPYIVVNIHVDKDPFGNMWWLWDLHVSEHSVWGLLRTLYYLRAISKPTTKQSVDNLKPMAELLIKHKPKFLEDPQLTKRVRPSKRRTYDKYQQYKPTMKGKGFSSGRIR